MIPDIKKILFTTDLSKTARHAYTYAVSLAGRYDAKITILYIMEEPSHTYSERVKDMLGEERWQKVQETHEEHARQLLIGKRHEAVMIREALDEFSTEALKSIGEKSVTPDEIVVSSGNVVEQILSESQSRECDVIVMGHHVRGKFEEAVLGSTTRRILRRSRIPVLLVRLPDDDD